MNQGNNNTRNQAKSPFIVKNGNKWLEEASRKKIPEMLFGEFWYENELTILFADTNVGKSILAVQIADSISSGKPIPGFAMTCPSQPVIYLDFELSDKQFEKRYSVNYQNHYRFSDNFSRAELDPDLEIPKQYSSFEDYMSAGLENLIVSTQAKVLIVDNITFLRGDNEKARDALPLMKELKALKGKYNLSILVLAHTPKRDRSKPLTNNDLQGSKMLINFCDSAFAIGESSQGPDIRFIKQIKQRNCGHIYNENNVCVFRLEQSHNFLMFTFLSHGLEIDHIREKSSNLEKIREGLELKKTGMSNVQVAKQVGVTEGAVRRWIAKYRDKDS